MSISGGTSRIFIDECGSLDHYDPIKHSKEDKFFNLTAVVIKNSVYQTYKQGMVEIRSKYQPYIRDIEVKSYFIRRSNPRGASLSHVPKYLFHQYPDGQVKYDSFCNDLKTLVARTSFYVISVNVDKTIAYSKYAHLPLLPTLLVNLWERITICGYLEKSPIKVVFDPRSKIDNRSIIASYQKFREIGSRYVKQSTLSGTNLKKAILPFSSELSYGIQLADYCAYPIRKSLVHPKYAFFADVISPKLHPYVRDKETGKVVNMGVKMVLSS